MKNRREGSPQGKNAPSGELNLLTTSASSPSASPKCVYVCSDDAWVGQLSRYEAEGL